MYYLSNSNLFTTCRLPSIIIHYFAYKADCYKGIVIIEGLNVFIIHIRYKGPIFV